MAFREKKYCLTVSYQPEIRIQECAPTEDNDHQYCMNVCFQSGLTIQDCTPTGRERFKAAVQSGDQAVCVLMMEWAQAGLQPKLCLDIIEYTSKFHAMYPCYLVQFGEIKYLQKDTTKHMYSDYKPLITAVYNRNHAAVESLMQYNMNVVFPDARGYGIFQGDKIVTTYVTSAVDIVMERDDVDTLRIMVHKYTALWDALMQLADQYNARKCQEFISSSSPHHHITHPSLHHQPTILPPFQNLWRHVRKFSSPFATKIQYETAAQMFAGSQCENEEQTCDDPVCKILKSQALVRSPPQDVDVHETILLHYYITLHTWRILMAHHSQSGQKPKWWHLVTNTMISSISEPHQVLSLNHEMLKILISSACGPHEHDLPCKYPGVDLRQGYFFVWMNSLYWEHFENKETMFMFNSSILKTCLMYGAINFTGGLVNWLAGFYHSLVTNEYSRLFFPITEAMISMLPHQAYETFRLRYKQRTGTFRHLPRCLVDLCRLWIYEHMPRGQMPSIVTQLGLPPGSVSVLTADTSPVLVENTFHHSKARKIIIQDQHRIAQMPSI